MILHHNIYSFHYKLKSPEKMENSRSLVSDMSNIIKYLYYHDHHDIQYVGVMSLVNGIKK